MLNDVSCRGWRWLAICVSWAACHKPMALSHSRQEGEGSCSVSSSMTSEPSELDRHEIGWICILDSKGTSNAGCYLMNLTLGHRNLRQVNQFVDQAGHRAWNGWATSCYNDQPGPKDSTFPRWKTSWLGRFRRLWRFAIYPWSGPWYWNQHSHGVRVLFNFCVTQPFK